MTRFERFIVSLAAWFSPSLDRLFRAAGGARQALAQLGEAQSLMRGYAGVREERQDELREASEMWAGPQSMALSEAGGSGSISLKERFWELELALEDRGWRRQLAISQLEFSRYGIQQIILISRLYVIKNPIVKRGVKISSYYVFGRGCDISSEDERTNEALQEFLELNAKELSHIGLVEKDQTLRTDGNLYFVFFSSLKDGITRVRTLDPIEVQEVISNPDDSSEPWYYLRTWEQRNFNPANGTIETEPKRAWHPAINFDPATKPAALRTDPVLWDAPVYHVKVGGLPKWMFGCPEVYATLDWARAYRKFLENWATITEALARFAWKVDTEGGTQAINTLSKVLSTTLADGGTQIETNPPPVMASTLVSGPSTKLTPLRTAGATTEPEQGRRILLMAAAADGLPETFYGDASTGSLATAQSLDRPTELQFLERQELWREILKTVCGYALARSARAPAGKLREAGKAAAKDRTVKVAFPAILEHDIEKRVGAIIEALTLQGFEVQGIDERVGMGLLLAELGYEDWPELLEEMYPEKSYDPDRTKEPEPEPAPAPAPGALPPGVPARAKPARAPAAAAKEALLIRAVADLRRALLKVKENGHLVSR